MENSYTNFYGLIFTCPLENEVQSCVYKNLRLLATKERLNYYDAMTEDEKAKLLKLHQKCLSVREKKSLFHESQ
ncbi:MAG: hypothetical protein WAO52_18315 [Prolixibacteraceae bacterium]